MFYSPATFESITCLFFKSLRAAKSSGASDGTLVTTPVPVNILTFLFKKLLSNVKQAYGYVYNNGNQVRTSEKLSM